MKNTTLRAPKGSELTVIYTKRVIFESKTEALRWQRHQLVVPWRSRTQKETLRLAVTISFILVSFKTLNEARKMPIYPSQIETRLFINGEFVNSVSGRTFKTINPATEEVICEVQEGDVADVDLAVRLLRYRSMPVVLLCSCFAQLLSHPKSCA
jgi:hypothetical protein